MATLTGVGLILKAVAGLKKYDKKTEQANFSRIEYQKILDEIRFYLRGEAFDEKVFLDRLKMIDNFVTDHCMEIPPSISKKYVETQPRSQGLLAFQYGGGSEEDPGTQQITCLQQGWRCIQNGGYGEKGEKNWVRDAKVKINKMAEKAGVQFKER